MTLLQNVKDIGEWDPRIQASFSEVDQGGLFSVVKAFNSKSVVTYLSFVLAHLNDTHGIAICMMTFRDKSRLENIMVL